MAPPAGLVERRAACEAVARRIAAMLRSGVDPNRPIPHSEWTVGEAAAHLAFTTLGLGMMARGIQIPYGDGTREGLQEANLVALEGYSERDLQVLADELLTHTGIVFDEASAAPPDQICVTPMGTVGIDGLTAYVLTHQAMHGSAISTALGAPLPFEPDDVALMWPFIRHALGQVLVPELATDLVATFAFQVTGTFSFGLRLGNGALESMSPAPAQADCVISGDAQALFLLLIKILDVEEAIKEGRLRLSGPRAELGFYLMDLFNIP